MKSFIIYYCATPRSYTNLIHGEISFNGNRDEAEEKAFPEAMADIYVRGFKFLGIINLMVWVKEGENERV
jgi:hypothetical protein